MSESQSIEYKSIKKIRDKHADWSGLAAECVGFANAQGGTLLIGVENATAKPVAGQRIPSEEFHYTIKKLKGNTENVSFGSSAIEEDKNGGQYIRILILPTKGAVATTSSGRVYLRVDEECLPIGGNDLSTLAAEKNDFQWELSVHKDYTFSDIDPEQSKLFLGDIRSGSNTNVSRFIKEKSDEEIFAHYHFVDEKHLTNLGVLWLGTPSMRAKLSYPLTAQYLVYDDSERKVRKESWHSCELNPKELILAIEETATELKYFYEFPQGLFREKVPHYSPEVLRELLVNAFAHQRLTLAKDVFIEVYPDRLRITSPGGLPIGVTTGRILHERFRRNPHHMTVFEALGLMEGEGSGYDLIYEKLSQDGKPLPTFENEFSQFSVTVSSRILDNDCLAIVDYASRNYDFRQKDLIVLGIVARERKVRSIELTQMLGLSDGDRLANWTSRLIEQNLIVQHGSKKATAFTLSPQLVKATGLNLPPTLKTMEPHSLDALVLEDLRHNGSSSISEICERIPDIERKEISGSIRRLRNAEKVFGEGAKKTMRYSLTAKNE